MQIYDAPLKDIRFLLETFGYDERIASLKKYEDFDIETVMALVEQSARFCTERMLPLNRVGDQQGLKFNPETHEVTTPDGFAKLYADAAEQGSISLTMPQEYGGVGAPHIVGMVMSEMGTAANKSFGMCAGLTHGLIDALVKHGSDWQKETFLPRLACGDWTGTMCLTEPQCGTDLGLLTTKAVPEDDHYILTGTKIWITFGEHDMAENIVHLVLARMPDAPEGIKGISLFIVPKFDLDGSRNPIYCTGLEHKMGIHASPTCVMSLEGAKGWLVGEPHKGMRGMFTMMNAARLLVGLEGVAMSEVSYQTALAFAKDRRQGRSLDKSKRDPNAKADTILIHPDVRRMLLNVKATNEGMRGLAYWAGFFLDLAEHGEDEEIRAEADDLMALMTPVIKSFMTEKGFDNINDALQVTGGAGYTTDWSIEQHMRDARISLIYEGTNHIQALDLIGRKLPRGNGRLYMRFNQHITDFIRANKDDERMAEFIQPLKETSKKLQQATMNLSMKGMSDPEEGAAVASHYLNVFGFTAMAFTWALQARAAFDRLDEGPFYATKIKTARYFFKHLLPEIDSLLTIIDAGKAAIMDFGEEEF